MKTGDKLMNQKYWQKERVKLKAEIKKLSSRLEAITPKKKRSKSYGRTKGLAFERTVANMLKHLFPDVRRQLEFQQQDAKGTDLQGTGIFKIQCKKYADYVAVKTINEVKCDETSGEVPLLVTAGTNLEPMVVIKLEHFIELLETTTLVES